MTLACMTRNKEKVAWNPDEFAPGCDAKRTSTSTADKVPLYWIIIGIVFVAFAMRVVVRC
jgi:hypothetical protein